MHTIYRNLPIKRPWALGIHGQQTGVGVYTEKPFVHITHIHTDHQKTGVGAYMEMGAYLGEYGILVEVGVMFHNVMATTGWSCQPTLPAKTRDTFRGLKQQQVGVASQRSTLGG